MCTRIRKTTIVELGELLLFHPKRFLDRIAYEKYEIRLRNVRRSERETTKKFNSTQFKNNMTDIVIAHTPCVVARSSRFFLFSFFFRWNPYGVRKVD